MLQTPSHQPLHHHHCLKNTRVIKGVRLASNWVDGRKGDGSDYLRNCEEAELPYGLREVVSQVLIILSGNDRRDLLQGMFRVFTEEDRPLLLDGGRSLHKAFIYPMLHKGDRLALSHQPYDGL